MALQVVGYCQGMNFIVGIMLLFLDEESAFWLLCCLLEEILPKDYYAQDLSGCNVDLRVFKHRKSRPLPPLGATPVLTLSWAVLNMHHNKLMKRCEEAGLGVEFFGLEWFIALFGKTMPIESTLRVWDCMFKEGNKIIFRIGNPLKLLHASLRLAWLRTAFFFAPGLGLIAANEKHLLAFKEPHELFQAVQGLGRQQLDVDSLLKPRFLVPQKVKKSKVEDLRKQYRLSPPRPTSGLGEAPRRPEMQYRLPPTQSISASSTCYSPLNPTRPSSYTHHVFSTEHPMRSRRSGEGNSLRSTPSRDAAFARNRCSQYSPPYLIARSPK